MKIRRTLLMGFPVQFLLLCGCTVAFVSCAAPSPSPGPLPLKSAWVDFVPVKPLDSPAPHGFCKISGGRLEVIVANQGNIPAAAPVEVRFSHAYAPPVSTPTIPSGDRRSVFVPIPPPIPAGDFGFTIFVDRYGDVFELSETNNNAAGWCIT